MKRYALINKDGTIVSFSTKKSDGSIEITGMKISGLKTLLDIQKEKALSIVRNAFQKKMNEKTSKYAKYELDSFVDQRTEWKLWMQDNDIDTPIVDALAESRGIDRSDLLEKIGYNVIEITKLQGLQNKIEDSIKMCQTAVEIEQLTNSL